MHITLQRKVLKACRFRLKEDMDDVAPIVKSMCREDILTPLEASAVNARTTRTDQADLLLAILDTKGTPAYPVFRKAIAKHYPNLAETLDMEAGGLIGKQYGIVTNPGEGSTAILCTAIQRGVHGAVRELLSAHICFTRHYQGLSPLETACKYNRETSALLLHEQGAVVSAPCLLLAAMHGSGECLTFALTHKVRISVADATDPRDGWTPLHHAAHAGHAHIVRLLLDVAGDVVAMTTYSGETALHLAVTRADSAGTQCARVLLNHNIGKKLKAVNLPNGHQDTPLHVACRHGDPHLINLLLEHGADINAQNKSLSTPLHVAIKSDVPERVEALLMSGLSQRTPSLIVTDEDDVSVGQLMDRLDEDSEMGAVCARYRDTLEEEKEDTEEEIQDTVASPE